MRSRRPTGHRLTDAHRAGRLAAELTELRRYGLIIVDEVGYLPFEQDAANLFFQLVSSRYEHASLVLTSNLPFSGWAGVFSDQVVAAAMIDRIVHHADVLTLKGASYRLRARGPLRRFASLREIPLVAMTSGMQGVASASDSPVVDSIGPQAATSFDTVTPAGQFRLQLLGLLARGKAHRCGTLTKHCTRIKDPGWVDSRLDPSAQIHCLRTDLGRKPLPLQSAHAMLGRDRSA